MLDAGQQRVQQVEVESEGAIVHWQRGQCVKVEAERQPIGLYPLLRNYDVWGVIVGTNWNSKRRKKRECTTCSFVFLDCQLFFSA